MTAVSVGIAVARVLVREEILVVVVDSVVPILAPPRRTRAGCIVLLPRVGGGFADDTGTLSRRTPTRPAC